jgi:hypothetical protein
MALGPERKLVVPKYFRCSCGDGRWWVRHNYEPEFLVEVTAAKKVGGKWTGHGEPMIEEFESRWTDMVKERGELPLKAIERDVEKALEWVFSISEDGA